MILRETLGATNSFSYTAQEIYCFIDFFFIEKIIQEKVVFSLFFPLIYLFIFLLMEVVVFTFRSVKGSSRCSGREWVTIHDPVPGWMSMLFPGINTDFQGSQTLFPLYGEESLRCALTLRLVSIFTQHTLSFWIKLSSGIYSPLIMRPPNVFITSLSYSFKYLPNNF